MVSRFGLTGPILTFRDVRAALNSKYGCNLSVGTVYRVAHGYVPQTAKLRAALGLPVLEPTAVCPTCAVVHVKRCPATRRPSGPRRDWKRESLELRRTLLFVAGLWASGKLR